MFSDDGESIGGAVPFVAAVNAGAIFVFGDSDVGTSGNIASEIGGI